MASTGIAYRNNRYIITNNPASLSAMDNQFFAGEIGVNGQYINYSGTGVSATNYQSSDITFKRFALAQKYSGIGEVLLDLFHIVKKIMSTQELNKSAEALPSFRLITRGMAGLTKYSGQMDMNF